MSSSNLLVIAAIQRWSKRQYLVAIEKSPVMATGRNSLILLVRPARLEHAGSEHREEPLVLELGWANQPTM